MAEKPAASTGQVELRYTYCHLLHAGIVDHELGWAAEELARHGARLSYFLSTPEPDFYPHYTHGLDSLFRFGGCIPAIHVKADLVDTVLLGLQWFREGGGMLVRADDGIESMADLAGRRVGLSRSLNAAKVDYRRVTEERGTELLLRLHGMRRDDLQIVDCPFSDDWYEGPGMAEPMPDLLDFWRAYGVQADLLQRPLQPELEAGLIDACFVTDPFGLEYTDSGSVRLVGSLARPAGPRPAGRRSSLRSHLHATVRRRAPGAGDGVPAGSGQGGAVVQHREAGDGRSARGDRVLPAGRDDAPRGGASRSRPEPLCLEPERARDREGMDARARSHRHATSTSTTGRRPSSSPRRSASWTRAPEPLRRPHEAEPPGRTGRPERERGRSRGPFRVSALPDRSLLQGPSARRHSVKYAVVNLVCAQSGSSSMPSTLADWPATAVRMMKFITGTCSCRIACACL